MSANEGHCSECGGSGYGPPDMKFDGSEYPPRSCDRCHGEGMEPDRDPTPQERQQVTTPPEVYAAGLEKEEWLP